MQPQLLNTKGLVLDRSEKGESFHHLRILSLEGGPMTCMQRRAKGLGQHAPDLFDHLELNLERRSHGGSWFIREWRLLRRFNGIGSSYHALREASLWARLVLANAQHMENWDSILEISMNSLAAWDRKAPALVVHLKALYLFARDEGLPVKEHWLAELPSEESEAAKCILSQAPEETADQEEVVADLLERLKRWVEHQHYIVVPR